MMKPRISKRIIFLDVLCIGAATASPRHFLFACFLLSTFFKTRTENERRKKKKMNELEGTKKKKKKIEIERKKDLHLRLRATLWIRLHANLFSSRLFGRWQSAVHFNLLNKLCPSLTIWIPLCWNWAMKVFPRHSICPKRIPNAFLVFSSFLFCIY